MCVLSIKVLIRKKSLETYRMHLVHLFHFVAQKVFITWMRISKLGRRSSGVDRVLCKSTDVIYKTYPINCLRIYQDGLVWHRLCVMWTSSCGVEFRLCILLSLVRSPVGDITVYTAGFICYANFLVLIIQFIYIYIYILFQEKNNIRSH